MSNIITAEFGNSRAAKTRPIFEYNAKQILQFPDLDLPDVYEVHMCNEGDEETKTAIGNANGVQIYNEYLRTGRNVVAYIVLHAEPDSRETEYMAIIPIKYRPIDGDAPPDPEQEDYIGQLITELNTGVDRAEAAAEEAERHAGEAQRQAEEAARYVNAAADEADRAELAASRAESAQADVFAARDEAVEAAGRAVLAESNAAGSAILARGYAEQTARDKAAAEDAADGAAESAESAARSAASIEGDVEQAEEAARQAASEKAAAEAARVAAEAAKDGAVTAKQGAEAAATNAGNSAGAAAQSAQDAYTSKTAAAGSASDALAAKNAAELAQQNAEEEADNIAASASQIEQNRQDIADQESIIEDLEALTNRKAGMLVDTASGAIASFVPDATIPDLLGVTVDIEPVQAGSGDPSPDNVRPISGRDAVEIDAAGENLLDSSIDAFQEGFKYLWQKDIIPANVEANMAFSDKDASVDVSRCFLGFVYDDLSEIDSPTRYRWIVNNGVLSFDKSNLSTVGALLCRSVFVYPKNTATLNKLFSRWNISVQLGSTASEYKSYSGNRYTIQLGQTVYGAKLTINEDGSLKALVDRAAVDMGSLNFGAWAGDSSGHTFATSLTGRKTDNNNILCSYYKTVQRQSTVWAEILAYDKAVFAPLGGAYLLARDTAYTSAVDFKTAVTGQTLCYELATPITIQLDPVTISTISGQTNNVWADAGDVDVTYAADIKAYIDRKIAALAAQIVNS